ncbi:MAG: BlaI/MecI/CopY family transcriptional regulator [Prevotellaceae bacterium]|jgi:predicted transcriptional regulator|nr:BlaI/MecI/CopY family transcriptional regulator [Prevotellaceae bacterium]
MEHLTNQEEDVMLLIWKQNGGFVKDILAIHLEPKPPYTTLASTIKNLERKGYVSSKRYGNTYEYTPLISEESYKRTFMSSVVKDYFKNSYKEMVAFFAKDEKISPEELKEILDLIEKKE